RHSLLLGVRSQELDVTEAIREGHLLLFRQVLSGEHQDGMLVEGLLHGLPGRGVHLGEGEAADHGAQRGIDRRDSWFHGFPPGLEECCRDEAESRARPQVTRNDQPGGSPAMGRMSIAMARGASAGCSPRAECVWTRWLRSSPMSRWSSLIT